MEAEPRQRKKTASIILVVLLIFAGLFIAYILYARIKARRPVSLQGVEVREYKGKNLSSVNDFVENSIKGPQYIEKKSYRLKVVGSVSSPLTLKYGDVKERYKRYMKVVRLDCVEGWSVTILWEGVLIRDILKDAKPKDSAKTVIFRAYDGYSTTFPLAYFYDKPILLAYKMNEVAIPPERGWPFMVVAEDKWGYKWAKWVTEIELSDRTDLKGYWEQRGYSDSGDRDKGYFEDSK